MPVDDPVLRAASPLQRGWRSAALVIFLLASADLVFACSYWHYAYALPPARLVQNIAAGLLGKRAFAGGADTVLLGLLLQYAMMSAMVGAYYLLSRRLAALRAHPWRYGSLYGVLLYIVMNEIVLPLSAAPKTPYILSWIISSIVMHWVIGVVTAHAARWAYQD
ncbi:hypothetical protein [Dyella acidiphila]|uniref:DUF1440 domain-containing protein n=1 Tax=Dyella acidiphila TaxID=2775866 RepID=A0ABR9G8M0_9GAMM|nr:hypothetical protein [Dyella acidiphila]MBE1160391.1 hypothetical protein [Dyella acidiphila]